MQRCWEFCEATHEGGGRGRAGVWLGRGVRVLFVQVRAGRGGAGWASLNDVI